MLYQNAEGRNIWSGNTNRNGEVSRDFYAPVYTNGWRIYPQDWSGGMTMTAKFLGRQDEQATYRDNEVLGSLNSCEDRESAGA